MDRADARGGEPLIRIGGVCGTTEQALARSRPARATRLSRGPAQPRRACKTRTTTTLIAHCEAVGARIPLVGFYLQPSVGGRVLPYAFWRRFAEIPEVVAIKIAPFNRYQTLDVVRAVVDARPRRHRALHRQRRRHRRATLVTPLRFARDGSAQSSAASSAACSATGRCGRKARSRCSTSAMRRPARGRFPRLCCARHRDHRRQRRLLRRRARFRRAASRASTRCCAARACWQARAVWILHERLSAGQAAEIDRVSTAPIRIWPTMTSSRRTSRSGCHDRDTSASSSFVLVAAFGAAASAAQNADRRPPISSCVDAKILTVDDALQHGRGPRHPRRPVRRRSDRTTTCAVTSGPRRASIDGRGRTVIPGFIDTHVHALGVAEAEATQPFVNLRSIGELQAWIRREAAAPAARDVDLDAACLSDALARAPVPDARGARRRGAAASRRRRRRLRVRHSTAPRFERRASRAASPDPPGGAIVKDAAGEPTGLLAQRREPARPLPSSRRDDPARHSRAGAPAVPCRRHHERDRTGRVARRVSDVRCAAARGSFAVRATVTIRIPRADDPAEVERFIRGLPFRFGHGDEWLKVGPLKIVADGGILIGTSFMRDPYGLAARQLYAVDDPSYRGFLTLTPQQIASAIAIGHRLGWQMVAHVTGDAGVDVVLDAIDAAQVAQPSADRRHTLIHAYFADSRDGGARSASPRPASTPSRRGTTRMPMRWRTPSAASAWRHFIGLRTWLDAGVARGDQHGSHVRTRSQRVDEPVQSVPDAIRRHHSTH